MLRKVMIVLVAGAALSGATTAEAFLVAGVAQSLSTCRPQI
jgi:hypothetical protein